jgi:hypothetical protein
MATMPARRSNHGVKASPKFAIPSYQNARATGIRGYEDGAIAAAASRPARRQRRLIAPSKSSNPPIRDIARFAGTL